MEADLQPEALEVGAEVENQRREHPRPEDEAPGKAREMALHGWECLTAREDQHLLLPAPYQIAKLLSLIRRLKNPR